MIIGLDVGGTHTDAALLHAGTASLAASAKAPTRQNDVLPGIVEALAKVLEGQDAARVKRLCVSSTLGLNALLTGSNDPVGMLVVPGPGMDPRLFWGPDQLFHVLPGAQDHRGRVIETPEREAVWQAFRAIAGQKARAIGVVCKFSPKNPELETHLCEMAGQEFGPDMPILAGSSVSGSLNFPRRMHTVWCNASLTVISRAFILALEQAAHDMGLVCPLVVLKADAGVFSSARAAADPAGSMGSGPAASLLGVWALGQQAPGPDADDVLMIDMGGTSTDLALMAKGQPLLAPEGLRVLGRPTLIRSLWTRSIALGGDSSLRVEKGQLRIGPDRSGPALSLEPGLPSSAGGRPPTLTDALNTLGLARVGEPETSISALADLARSPGSPEQNATALARGFVDLAAQTIAREYQALLEEVNMQPVYTIRELLVSGALRPASAVFIGGPATSLAPALESALGIPVAVPEESPVANAVGAALARPTRTAELYADTLLGRMSIPDFGLEKSIDKSYSLEQARQDLRDAFAKELAEELAGDSEGASAPQTVSAESFAMLDDQGRRGRIIRLRMQQSAGLLTPTDLEPAV